MLLPPFRPLHENAGRPSLSQEETTAPEGTATTSNGSGVRIDATLGKINLPPSLFRLHLPPPSSLLLRPTYPSSPSLSPPNTPSGVEAKHTPRVLAVASELQAKGVPAVLRWVPEDYYQQPLEYRRQCLEGTSVDHLCKTVSLGFVVVVLRDRYV